jgi:serine/threonine-protein kinase
LRRLGQLPTVEEQREKGNLQVTASGLVGQVLAGKYRVERVLGEGGMGFVVAAHHLQLDTTVAIKLLRPELLSNAEAVARFAREARAAVRIVSQHVARVLDVGTLEDGAPYMVMEFLEGGDLSSVLAARGPLPMDEAVDYVLQACEAIAEAHAMGIVHRDLKPANLFCVRRPDGTSSIKVLDFGISKITGSFGTNAADHGMTKTTALMGSPYYMSPEQMESTRGVDLRTDIWALGVILYELVAGRTPFQGSTLPEICVRIATQQPLPMRSLRADVPPALEAIIVRCLEKDRERRYGDVGTLAGALAPFASPRGRLSVETVLRTAQQQGRATGTSSMRFVPGELGAGTISPVQTHAVRGKGKAATVVIALLAAAVVGVVAVAAIIRKSTATQPPIPVQTAAQVRSAAAPPPPSVALEQVQPTAASAVPAVASHAVVSPPPSPGPATRRQPVATPPASASSKPQPQPQPRPNCDPNFYLDAQGEKHFKPECFR